MADAHVHHGMVLGHTHHQILANSQDSLFYSPDLLPAETVDGVVEVMGLVLVNPEDTPVVPGIKNRFGLGTLGILLLTLL